MSQSGAAKGLPTRMLPPPPQATRDGFLAVRLILALLVVFGHSYPLGGFENEPLSRGSNGQASPDGIAVKSFFVMSGYLLMHALDRRPSIRAFALRRCFRILPAFWVCLLVTAFLLVPLLIKAKAPWPLPYWQYLILDERNAFTYVTRNAFLYIHQWEITPVFIENHFPSVINGSLWTLSCEALCYLLLGIGAITGLAVRRWVAFSAFALLYVPTLALLFVPIPRFPGRSAWSTMLNWSVHPSGHGLVLAFTAGIVAYWLTSGRRLWNPLCFALAVVTLIASLRLGSFALLWPFLLPYFLLNLARAFQSCRLERFGDFSYGTYLYAFPIQQSLYSFGVHEGGGATYLASGLVLSVLCGALSWHLIERPAINFGSSIIRLLERGTKPAASAGEFPSHATPAIS